MKSKLFWLGGVVGVILLGVVAWKTWADPAPDKDPVAKLYRIEPNQAATTAKGAQGTTYFQILLVKGAYIHPKAPFGCKLAATKGISLPRHTLGRPDAQSSKDNRLVKVSLTFQGRDPGQQSVTASCHFFVCTKEICARREEKINLPVKIR